MVAKYTSQVRPAIYVIKSIQANNASVVCADADLIKKLDAFGYDGQYAQRLICESAIGIQLFSNLEQTLLDMQNALTSLNDSENDNASASRPSLCQNLNIDTLEEADLDGPGIQQAVCNVSSATTASKTSTIGAEKSSSNASVQQPPTTVPTTGSLQSASQSLVRSNPSDTISTPSMMSNSLSKTPSSSNSTHTAPSSVPATGTPQTASSSFNDTTIRVVTITNFTTTWVTATRRPSQSHSATNNGEETTVVRTVTSTSTVDLTITLSGLGAISAFNPMFARRRKPWQWHEPLHPSLHSKPSRTRVKYTTSLAGNCTQTSTILSN